MAPALLIVGLALVIGRCLACGLTFIAGYLPIVLALGLTIIVPGLALFQLGYRRTGGDLGRLRRHQTLLPAVIAVVALAVAGCTGAVLAVGLTIPQCLG